MHKPLLTLLTLLHPVISHPHTVPAATKRFIPLPPSTYISTAKLSTKAILILIISILVTLTLSTITCYICLKRRRSRARRRQLAKERSESRQLKPRINKRNAKFFAPGIVMDRLERERTREMMETERVWTRDEDVEYEMRKLGGFPVGELQKPEKAKGGWKEVLRGVVVRK